MARSRAWGISRGLVAVAILMAAAVAAAYAAGGLAAQQRTATVTSVETVTATVERTSTVESTVTATRTVAATAVQTITETITVAPQAGQATVTLTATVTATVERVSTVTATATAFVTTTRTVTATAAAVPPGATPLPYSGNVTFALVSTGFNFNGSPRGGLVIYVPAGWGIVIAYANQHAVPHSIALVRNSTPSPQSADVGQDGQVVASQPPDYRSGIPSGQVVVLSVASVPEGVYWIACGVPGHARGGMWAVLVSSPSVSVPYAVSSPGGTEGGGYGYGLPWPLALLLAALAAPLALRALGPFVPR